MFAGYFKGKKYNEDVDDVVIGYNMTDIDGPNNVLGRAGAAYMRYKRSSSTGWIATSPISGIMEFDIADFDNMSQSEYTHDMSLFTQFIGISHDCTIFYH